MFMNLFISWWLFALRGLLAFFFGVLALADGILGLIVGIGVMGSNERWWMALLEGVAGIIIGILTLSSLDKITPALVYFIASGMVLVDVIELVAAIQLRLSSVRLSERRYLGLNVADWAFRYRLGDPAEHRRLPHTQPAT